MPLAQNTRIGDYRITGLLGQGGMGEVYRALHTKIDRDVAIKLLQPSANAPGFNERFVNEARLQAKLQHPNIATLYDFLEFQGQPCIIMEFVDGATLHEHISARGMLSAVAALKIFHDIVAAIDYIHSRGIIHRDIKSTNVKIDSGGTVKLLDFGIAVSLQTPSITAKGSVIGTWEYMPAEQLEGAPASPLTDIWALGVLLYEMVTNRLPFRAPTFAELYNLVSAVNYTPPTAFNPALPPDLLAIIDRCLRRNPVERYQSARALLADVQRVLASIDPTALAERSANTAKATARAAKHLLLILVVGLVVLGFFAALGTTGYFWYRYGSPLAIVSWLVNGGNFYKEPPPRTNNAAALAAYKEGLSYSKKDLDTALRHFNRAIELDANFAAAYKERAEVQLYKSQELFIKDLNRAIELETNNWSFLVRRSSYYQTSSKNDLALKDLNAAIDLNPYNAYLYILRGGIYMNMDDFDAAERDFDRAGRMDSNFGPMYKEQLKSYKEYRQKNRK